MDFLKYISTPAGTTEAAPLITTIKLTRGRLTGGFLYFPAGPAGKLHFIARVGIHQIVPFNTGESYRLNDCVVPLDLGITLKTPPYEIDCLTWNDSTEYAHALTVCFFLRPMTGRNKEINTIDEMHNQLRRTKKEGYWKP